jgi:hypothetical protein
MTQSAVYTLPLLCEWVSESHNFAIVTSDDSSRFPLLQKHHFCNYVPLFHPLAQAKRRDVRRSCEWIHAYFITRPRTFCYPAIRGPLPLRNIRFLLLSTDAIFEIFEAMGIRPEETHSATCQDIYIRGTDSLSVAGDRINGFVEPWVEPRVCVCMIDRQAGSHICTCTPIRRCHTMPTASISPHLPSRHSYKRSENIEVSFYFLFLLLTQISKDQKFILRQKTTTHKKSFFIPLK